MKYTKQKQEVIDASNEMMARGLSKLTGGNLSVYIREDDVMLITPGSTPYHKLQVEDIVEMKLDGTVLNQAELDKRGKFRSSEWEMHAVAYSQFKDVNAFVHAHPIFAMAVGTVYDKLPAIDYLIAHTGKAYVPVVPFDTYGTPELAQLSLEGLKTGCKAVLLRNHGINSVGFDLDQALKIATNVEFLSEMYWRAKCIGEPTIISDEKLQETLDKFSGKKNTYT